jgi:hypothetical protein
MQQVHLAVVIVPSVRARWTDSLYKLHRRTGPAGNDRAALSVAGGHGSPGAGMIGP